VGANPLTVTHHTTHWGCQPPRVLARHQLSYRARRPSCSRPHWSAVRRLLLAESPPLPLTGATQLVEVQRFPA